MRPTECGQNTLNLLAKKRQEKIFTAELFVYSVIRECSQNNVRGGTDEKMGGV